MTKPSKSSVNFPASEFVDSSGTKQELHRLSDEALALRLQAGDRRAFDEIVTRYQGRIYAVAYRICGGREDALDVTQEVLLKVYRQIPEWKPSGKFGAWLLRIAVNRAIDGERRRRRIPYAVSLDSDRAPAIAATGQDASERARGAEISGRIQEALGQLSPTQRSVFVLRHFEGHSLAEIAAIVGCTVGSVKVHLFRAMRKMRNELVDLRN